MFLKTDMADRYDIRFLVTHEDGTKFHKLVIMLAGIVRLIFTLLTKHIDIVHIHCGDLPSPCRKFIFFTISRCFKRKVVLHWHGGNFLAQYQKASGFWRGILKLLFEGADVVVCLSQSWKENLGAIFGKSNFIVVRNGIVPPDLMNIAQMVPNRPTRIVFLGWLIPEKGLYDLLSVLERLIKKEGLDVQLLIGGKGDVEKLNRHIASHHLKDHVRFLGWIGDRQKEQLLQSSDIFALPSYGEAMPMSILEAMGYGLPVVSTRVGAIPEQVENGISGFLLNPGDLENLYDSLKALILDRDLRIKMGRSGRKKIEKDFDVRKNCQIICKAYDQLLML